MRLIFKPMALASGDFVFFHGIASTEVDIEAGAAKCRIASWPDEKSAEALLPPSFERSAVIHLGGWSEESAGSLIDLVGTLPEFSGGEIVDTVQSRPQPFTESARAEDYVFDVGSAPQ